jgi:hypothetical protein
MQRLFSMFPQGGPGVALLMLRVAVAATFFMNTANRVHIFAGPWLFAVVLLVSFSIGIGFLTPLLSVIACAAALVSLLLPTHNCIPFCVPTILDAVALALLGPGAYSLDARLFGRRVTVITRRKDRNGT